MTPIEKCERAHSLRMHLIHVHGHNPLRVSDLLTEQAEATHWEDHNIAEESGESGGLLHSLNHTEPDTLHAWKGADLDALLQRSQDSMLQTLSETVDVEDRLNELHRRLPESKPVPQPLTGLQQHLLDVHKNEAAGNLTMTQALSYHAQEHLGASGIRNHSEPRQLHRELAYRLAAIQGLNVPKDDIPHFLDQVLEGKIRGDREDERAAVEAVLNRASAGWTTRTRSEWQPEPDAFRAYLNTLSDGDRWMHCRDRAPHDEHPNTVVMNEGPTHGTCVGTPDVMATPPSGAIPLGEDWPDITEAVTGERARAQRPGSQPLPVTRKDVLGSHDMVIADLHGIMTRRQVALRNAGQTKEADAVRKLMNEIEADLKRRRALGVERYGSLLQPGNGRDPLRDAYEEAIDLVAYFRQLIMARDEAIRELLPLKDALNYNGHAVIDRVIYLLAGDIKKGI